MKPPLTRKPRWTPGEDDRLKRLMAEHRSIDAIAERLKRTKSAVYKRAKRLGASPKASPSERLMAARAFALAGAGLKAR
jgi:hypothetical protein